MFPITIMPSWMVMISEVNPMTWAVKALEVALWKEGTAQELFLPVFVPLIAGLFFFSFSVLIFRWSVHRA
jgi:ABC-type multidrug transport system permease subunit